MKGIAPLAAAAALSLLSSCTKDISELKTEAGGRVVEISARMPQTDSIGKDGQTKVNVSTGGKVTWEASDKIAAFNTTGTKFTFSLVEGAGTSQALFRCESFSGTLGTAAVYPAGYAGDKEGTVIYPSVRDYDGNEPTPVVMAAHLEGNPVKFVQLGGVLELNMYDIPAYARAMRVESGSRGISGSYGFDASDPCAIRAATGHPSSVEIRFPIKTGYRRNTRFCIPVPAGDYDDLFVRFLDGDEDIIEGTEFIKIPDKYGTIKANDYVSMAQLDVRSKVTRRGYIKVEGVKWAGGNLRAWKDGTDGDGFQQGWNIWDEQYKTEYSEVTSGQSSGTPTSYAQGSTCFDHFNWGGLSRSSRVNDAGYITSTTPKLEMEGKIFSIRTGDADAFAAAELKGEDRWADTGTFQSTESAIYGDLAFWASKGRWRLPYPSELHIMRGDDDTDANVRAGYCKDSGGRLLYGILLTSTPSWEKCTVSTEAVELTDADLEAGLFLPKGGRRVPGSATTVKYPGGQAVYWSGTNGAKGSDYPTYADCVTILGFNASNGAVYGYTTKWNGDNIGDPRCGNMIRPVLYNPSDEVKTPKPQPGANSLPPWKKGELDIHFISTGRGECNLVIMPDGTSILIDAGEVGESDGVVARKPSSVTSEANFCRVYKAYTTYMKYFLQNTRHNYIDYALATHYHSDHIGVPNDKYKKSASGSYVCTGFSAIYEDLPIRKLVDRLGPGVGFDDFRHIDGDCHEGTYSNYTAFAAEKQKTDGMEWYKVNPNPSKRNIQFKPKYDDSCGATFNVIGYGYNYWNGSSFTSMTDGGYENARSVTTLLSFGDFDCYFGADCHAGYGCGIMTKICQHTGKVEALKAPHHMAVGSLTEAQTSLLRPKVTVVDVLAKNVPDAECARAAAEYGDVFATSNEAGTPVKDCGGHFCIRVTDNAGKKTFMVYKLCDTDFSYGILASYGPYSCH